MLKKLLLAAAAVASLGSAVAADAYPGERHDRREIRQDRRDMRHDRIDRRHDRRAFRHYHRGRYYWHGRYYNNRYRHNGAWLYR